MKIPCQASKSTKGNYSTYIYQEFRALREQPAVIPGSGDMQRQTTLCVARNWGMLKDTALDA